MYYVTGAVVLLASLAYWTIKVMLAIAVLLIWLTFFSVWALIIGVLGLIVYTGLRLTSRSSKKTIPRRDPLKRV